MAYKLRDLADSVDGVVARGAGGRLVPTPGSMVLNFFQIVLSSGHYNKQTKENIAEKKKCHKYTLTMAKRADGRLIYTYTWINGIELDDKLLPTTLTHTTHIDVGHSTMNT